MGCSFLLLRSLKPLKKGTIGIEQKLKGFTKFSKETNVLGKGKKIITKDSRKAKNKNNKHKNKTRLSDLKKKKMSSLQGSSLGISWLYGFLTNSCLKGTVHVSESNKNAVASQTTK